MNRWILAATLFAATAWAADTNAPATGSMVTAGPTNEPTVVTSDRLQVDYARNVGTFEGNVLAVDPRITVRADKIIAFFGDGSNTTRTLQRMVAEGGVVLSQDNRKATAERAEYTASESKVVLTGKPEVETPQGKIVGAKITFWQGRERMEVESAMTDTNRTRLIFQPEPPKE
jgi:lipopolysaccharide export system protein LptA